jgi:hypothetical protein
MFFDSRFRPVRAVKWLCPLAVALALMILAPAARAQDPDIAKKLGDFDAYMAQTAWLCVCPPSVCERGLFTPEASYEGEVVAQPIVAARVPRPRFARVGSVSLGGGSFSESPNQLAAAARSESHSSWSFSTTL